MSSKGSAIVRTQSRKFRDDAPRLSDKLFAPRPRENSRNGREVIGSETLASQGNDQFADPAKGRSIAKWAICNLKSRLENAVLQRSIDPLIVG